MPNLILDAYKLAKGTHPLSFADQYKIARLLEEFIEHCSRGTAGYGVPAGDLTEFRDDNDALAGMSYVQMSREFTLRWAGGEYTLPNAAIYAMTAGEFGEFAERVPTDAYTITNRAAFDASGTILSLIKEGT